MLSEFRNESFTDFSCPVNQEAMVSAIAYVKTQLGKEYPLVIGGEAVESSAAIISTNPGAPQEVVGRFAKSTSQSAEAAMQAALSAFQSWSKVPAVQRARCLLKAAAIMRRRRLELAAWIICEIGKNWVEADADVAEAIDFCEFYAREMIRISQPQPLVPSDGEENDLTYLPLGVGIVIPPWNFPLAILVGMTTASIVCGNTVVLKPSSETPVIGYQFVKIMEEAGLPPGVINYLPGSGSEVGDFLVQHPKTRFVAFTGSKEVGLRINELAAKTQSGQIWIKRVVSEMGGKDSIIIDSGVDADLAADGIVASAFGFQGQKCSACSRVIVHKDLYDQVLAKVVAGTKKIVVGPAEDKRTFMGPVASQSAYNSILKYIEIGKKEGRLMCGGEAISTAQGGFFIQPTVIADASPTSRIAQEEIFGPVLTFIKANSWQQALEIGNNTEFGLTGAAYSTDRRHLEQARAEFHVGNLYLNRKCTGALVGIHPFGGFNMSGTDSKGGGRDYLLLFTQAKVVCERF